jgi:DNA-binding IscR family transcriptional regulator
MTALAERVGAPLPVLRPILRSLTEHQVLIEVDQGGEEQGYVPGRGLAELSLADVIRALRHHGDDVDVQSSDHGHERVRQILAGADQAAMAHLASPDLGALAKIAPLATGEQASAPGRETARPAPTQTVHAAETVNLPHPVA